MSIQPSSRFRPSTFGTFLMLVRNILAPSDADVIPVVAFTAFASAAPIISPLFVMIVLPNLAPKPAIDFMRHHEIVAVDAEPAAGVHHLVGGGGERRRAAELCAPRLSASSMSFCCSVTSASGTSRHLAFQNERPAIAQHRRGRDALEDGIDRGLARHAALLGERDRLAEADHLDHQQQIDRDLHLAGEAVAADAGHLRPDRQQHRLGALERCGVAADHDRGLAGLHRDRAARQRAVQHDRSGLGEFVRRPRGSRPARSCSCRCRCRPCAGPTRCRRVRAPRP